MQWPTIINLAVGSGWEPEGRSRRERAVRRDRHALRPVVERCEARQLLTALTIRQGGSGSGQQVVVDGLR